MPGYRDRTMPLEDKAAATLKKHTLTNLYNEWPASLGHCHRELDQSVAEAYGWGTEWRAGVDDDQTLARQLRLNQRHIAATGEKAA